MEKLKVYLASRWEDRDEIIQYRNYLIKAANIESTGRWLSSGHPRLKRKVARDYDTGYVVQSRDVEDIMRSDVVVVFSPLKAHGNGTGGRHVECGIAIGTNKPIFLVGVRENVFHCHDNVTNVKSVKALVPHFKKLLKKKAASQKTMDRLIRSVDYWLPCYDGADDGGPRRR